MQHRIRRNRQLCGFGMLLMLAAGVGSVTMTVGGNLLMPLLTVAGGVIALAARVRERQWQCRLRAQNDIISLAEYPLHVLRNPRLS